VLTLQWILQVLLTNEIVKIDCLVRVGVFLDVNRGWTGNKGVRFGFVPRVEIMGYFWPVNSC
jgi:hypothetical protein